LETIAMSLKWMAREEIGVLRSRVGADRLTPQITLELVSQSK
jgi:hypothetical protein